ncbi:MAG: hypothetical protein ACYC3G_04015 [Minisyncoccota bacterium]
MAFGLLRFPKNDRHFLWTDHSKSKMIQYFISESKIRGVIKKHNRIETGIAPNTVAVMQRNDKGKKKEELWVMYQKSGDKKFGEKLKIISVWRYPGVSPKKEIPIPDDVLKELVGVI